MAQLSSAVAVSLAVSLVYSQRRIILASNEHVQTLYIHYMLCYVMNTYPQQKGRRLLALHNRHNGLLILILVLVLVDVGRRSISFIVPHSSSSRNGS